jgi:RNA polymerase sigma-70 factor (ECF subfamily)
VLDELSDEQLMVRYQRGDAKAFEMLLGRHYQPIFNFLFRYTGNRATSEELLQDVFTRVVRGAAEYRQRAKFTTWLYTIARNITIDHARKQKFRRHQSLDQPIGDDDGGARMIDRVKDEHPSGMGDRKLGDTQFKRALSEALERMNEDQRLVFTLREFQHLSFKDIASVVKTSENTVKSRMRYALEFLREALADFAGGGSV